MNNYLGIGFKGSLKAVYNLYNNAGNILNIEEITERLQKGDKSALEELDKNNISYTYTQTTTGYTIKFKYNGQSYEIKYNGEAHSGNQAAGGTTSHTHLPLSSFLDEYENFGKPIGTSGSVTTSAGYEDELDLSGINKSRCQIIIIWHLLLLFIVYSFKNVS